MPSKKLQLKFYADECFPVPSVTHFKSLGYSFTHAYDYKLVGKKDSIHLRHGKNLGRVLITLDRDFLYYERAALEKHPGVIVISGSPTPLSVNKICEKLFKNISRDYIKGSLLKVTIDKITKLQQGRIISSKKI